MTFYLASDESAGFPVKAAEVEAIVDPLNMTGDPPVFARLTVDDWDGDHVDAIICNRFGGSWSAPTDGTPRYIRLWFGRRGEALDDILARARAGDSAFSWFILCGDRATAERYALAQ